MPAPRMGAPERWLREVAAAYIGDSCLEWPFPRRYPNGYGALQAKVARTTAHRFVCVLAHGEPQGRLDAAHICHNRLCCNPQHLRWATRRDNLADRVVRRTVPQGDSHGMTKYSDETVRRLVVDYWSFVEETAAKLGMDKAHAHRILRGAGRKEISNA